MYSHAQLLSGCPGSLQSPRDCCAPSVFSVAVGRLLLTEFLPWLGGLYLLPIAYSPQMGLMEGEIEMMALGPGSAWIGGASFSIPAAGHLSVKAWKMCSWCNPVSTVCGSSFVLVGVTEFIE